MTAVTENHPRLASDPEVGLVLQFIPAKHRGEVAAVIALQRELLAMSDSISESEVLVAKLSWWFGELSACVDGVAASHPLVREIQSRVTDFDWSGWHSAVANLLAEAGDSSAVDQATQQARRLEQGGAMLSAWAGLAKGDAYEAFRRRGALLQLVDAMRRDRGRADWLGLDVLARYQLRRRDVIEAIAAGGGSGACSRMLSEQAESWLAEWSALAAPPLICPRPVAAMTASLQMALARRWLEMLRRRPLAVLGARRQPTMARRLFAVWRQASRQRRQHPEWFERE